MAQMVYLFFFSPLSLFWREKLSVSRIWPTFCAWKFRVPEKSSMSSYSEKKKNIRCNNYVIKSYWNLILEINYHLRENVAAIKKRKRLVVFFFRQRNQGIFWKVIELLIFAINELLYKQILEIVIKYPGQETLANSACVCFFFFGNGICFIINVVFFTAVEVVFLQQVIFLLIEFQSCKVCCFFSKSL